MLKLRSYDIITRSIAEFSVKVEKVGRKYASLHYKNNLVGYVKSKDLDESPECIDVYPSTDSCYSTKLDKLVDCILDGLFLRVTSSYYIMPLGRNDNYTLNYMIMTKTYSAYTEGICDRLAYQFGYVESQYPEIGTEIDVDDVHCVVTSVAKSFGAYRMTYRNDELIMFRENLLKYIKR